MTRPRTSRLPFVCFLFLCLGACDRDRSTFDDLCRRDDAAACATLGEMKLTGEGGESHRMEGAADLARSCRLRASGACTRAGAVYYARGNKNDRIARDLFEQGCAIEDPEACESLGWMETHAEGGSIDLARGMKHLTWSCEEGRVFACSMAAQASTGSPSDARQWWSRACTLGHPNACGHLPP